ncbi:universal stress protein [Magnetospirillum sp. UT-4]|uniref:universal stress protein n=1 Tax=Magnetospirillum sp. UT-4 TaxID=2681467 RepID=UPI0013819E51|nr:universal stress protein [Magnetospirillum sp. UT-4]CAA7616325.1 Universal stress protein UspA-like nucleotide-binding protein [Magnetospirillum sp. UT-4]
MPESSARAGRVFLVMVDDSAEVRAAMRFACCRARHTGGRVALLRVIEPTEAQDFVTIGDLMRAEARQEAEDLLQELAAQVNEMSGQLPVLYVREGIPRDELLRLIAEEPDISVLVLAAAPGPRGPGPLVTALTGKLCGMIRVPLTIVPAGLGDDGIDAIA